MTPKNDKYSLNINYNIYFFNDIEGTNNMKFFQQQIIKLSNYIIMFLVNNCIPTIFIYTSIH